MLASFNHHRRMKAESRQIPQKLTARLKFVYCYYKSISVGCLCPKLLWSYRTVFCFPFDLCF